MPVTRRHSPLRRGSGDGAGTGSALPSLELFTLALVRAEGRWDPAGLSQRQGLAVNSVQKPSKPQRRLPRQQTGGEPQGTQVSPLGLLVPGGEGSQALQRGKGQQDCAARLPTRARSVPTAGLLGWFSSLLGNSSPALAACYAAPALLSTWTSCTFPPAPRSSLPSLQSLRTLPAPQHSALNSSIPRGTEGHPRSIQRGTATPRPSATQNCTGPTGAKQEPHDAFPTLKSSPTKQLVCTLSRTLTPRP